MKTNIDTMKLFTVFLFFFFNWEYEDVAYDSTKVEIKHSKSSAWAIDLEPIEGITTTGLKSNSLKSCLFFRKSKAEMSKVVNEVINWKNDICLDEHSI